MERREKEINQVIGERTRFEIDRKTLKKMFRQYSLDTEQRIRVKKEVFPYEESQCRVLNIEFMRNFFGAHEERFLELASKYLGDIVYFNMNETQAYFIIEDKEYQAYPILERNLQNLVHKVTQLNKDEVSVIVGKPVYSVEGLLREIRRVHSVRLQVFGYNNGIVWLTEENKKSIEAMESVQNQFLLAAEANKKKLIKEFSRRLLKLIVENRMLSRLYTQNICYTMIHAVYSKNDIDHEMIMKAVNILFRSDDLREILLEFETAFEEIIELLPDSEIDEEKVVDQIKEMVAREEKEKIGLTRVARKFQLEPSYVSYIFKTIEGKTLMQYVEDLKAEEQEDKEE